MSTLTRDLDCEEVVLNNGVYPEANPITYDNVDERPALKSGLSRWMTRLFTHSAMLWLMTYPDQSWIL
jgi:hypothetical protein